jgi:transcriptional regulator with XRE-family HTH domain
MIREKLIEAREKQGWTLEYLAQLSGVDVVTVYRWERGISSPQSRHRRRLVQIFDASEYDLGLVGIHVPAVAVPSVVMAPLPDSDTLANRLLTIVLRWPRNCTKYAELQEKIRILTDAGGDAMKRRDALGLLATLPISTFSLSPMKAVTSMAGEEILPWLASGLTSAWKMGRGSDLTVVDMVAASYLPTLMALTNTANHRKPASALVTQAYLLRATMGWELRSADDAIFHVKQAEHYSKIAGDAALQADVFHRSGISYFVAHQYDAALRKMLEAQYFIEHHQPVPPAMKRRIYLALAAYQARCGLIDDAKKTLKLAYKYHYTGEPTAHALSYADEAASLRWEGLTFAHANRHEDALDLYEQAWKINKDQPVAERTRVELIKNQLHSLLNQRNRDMEQCIALWIDAISSAQEMRSERSFTEACHILEIMEAVWPGEKDIADLREIAAHW